MTKELEIAKYKIENDNKFDNISFETGDGLDIFFNEKRNAENKIVVCTACEHIDSEELYFYLSNKNKNMLVCLQSNNYYEVNSHVNCHDSLEEFIKAAQEANPDYTTEEITVEYNKRYGN